MSQFNIPLILRAILKEYTLPEDGDHGVAHWARVYETGLRIASLSGADPQVVQLFAIFHDSRRINELTDPHHGPRAAAFAEQKRGHLFQLPDQSFQLLHEACADHTRKRTHPDITIQTCWDADRLDLGRVGVNPDRRWLNTDAAQRLDIFQWADSRAWRGVIPDIVAAEWGIALPDLGR